MRLNRSNWLGVAFFSILSLMLAHCSKDDGGGGGGGGGGKPKPVDCEELALQAAGDDAAAKDGKEANEVDCEELAGNDTPSDPGNPPSSGDGPAIPQDVMAGLKEGHGCLQGVVTDGFTGQAIDLSDKLADPSGIYVLIRNTKLKAQIIPNDANLVGQYFICGIPLEETYPVFAFLSGYFAFESTVNITSTRPGAQADGDVRDEFKKADPITRTNLALFPMDSGGKDFVVRTYHEGKPVEGAIVDVEPLAGGDHFAFEGTFASAADTRLFPMRATTDAAGLVTFGADKMALGHRYRISVTPPEGMDLSAPTARELTFGISGAAINLDQNNYILNFDMGDAEQALAIISCSPQGETYNTSGTIQVVFNRDVAIVSPDLWTATLSGAAVGSLAANIPGNGAAEQVSATVAGGNTLVLQPKFGTAVQAPDYSLDKSNNANDDVDAVITYAAAAMNLTVVGDNTVNATALTAIPGAAMCSGFNIRFFREFP